MGRHTACNIHSDREATANIWAPTNTHNPLQERGDRRGVAHWTVALFDVSKTIRQWKRKSEPGVILCGNVKLALCGEKPLLAVRLES